MSGGLVATPMTADQLVKALRDEGVRYVEHRSWRTHNRNHKGPWGPVYGVYIHHTAGVSKYMADVCYDGYAELPGPVCHGMLAKSATLYLVGHGRANHAGGIAQNAYDAAVNEESTHPRPDAAEPIDGNVHFYGLEIENEGDGSDPFPADQYDQAVRWAAAHCRFHGWTADSVIGHKEATRRKTDPAFSMTKFRADVAERLAHPASWSPGDIEEDDDMPLSDADVKKVAAAAALAVHSYRNKAANDASIKATGKPIPDSYGYTTQTHGMTKGVAAKIDALTAVNAKLVEAVAALAADIGDLDPDAIVSELRQAIESINVRLDVADA